MNNKSNEEMAKRKPKKHVIAYIDLLGTSERIKKDYEYKEFLKIQNAYEQMKKIYTEGWMKQENIKVKFFSDNIIIAREVTVDNNESISFLINQMNCLAADFQFVFLICRVPTRGGLTVGELFIDDTFVWGTGLLRAYELENKIAVFPRIVIDPLLLDTVISEYANNVKTYRIDGGLPIVDCFSLINDNGTLEETKKAVKDLLSEASERTVGKIEWLRASLNLQCQKMGIQALPGSL